MTQKPEINMKSVEYLFVVGRYNRNDLLCNTNFQSFLTTSSLRSEKKTCQFLLDSKIYIQFTPLNCSAYFFIQNFS